MNHHEIADDIGKLAGTSILVAGDLMLDEYLWGKTERISPEAPVPIVDISRQELRLGGAGNVINNLVSLGCRVHVVGALAEDEDGRTIRQLLAEKGLDLARIASAPARITTRKTRILGTGQQMLRVDKESREWIGTEVEAQILSNYVRCLEEGVQAVVLSDYGKGTLTDALLRQMIDLARTRGLAVLVDPKGSDFTRYAGATFLTPNRREASRAAGMDVGSESDLVALGAAMRQNLQLDALLITRSEEGMSLFDHEGVHHLRAQAREVFDVSGAGDTVIAVLAAGVGAGLGFLPAARLANLAAGIVVGKIGTSTVSGEELLLQACQQTFDIDQKIKSRDTLAGHLRSLQESGRKVVFTNGCFDLLHVGHVKYLQAARQLGDLLVLGLNSDQSVLRLKGENRPLLNQEERSHILAALGCIDYIVIFDEDTPLSLIEALRPDILVKGGDYTKDEVVGRELVESYGGRVELISFVAGKSTTNIIDKILAQYGAGKPV